MSITWSTVVSRKLVFSWFSSYKHNWKKNTSYSPLFTNCKLECGFHVFSFYTHCLNDFSVVSYLWKSFVFGNSCLYFRLLNAYLKSFGSLVGISNLANPKPNSQYSSRACLFHIPPSQYTAITFSQLFRLQT